MVKNHLRVAYLFRKKLNHSPCGSITCFRFIGYNLSLIHLYEAPLVMISRRNYDFYGKNAA